MSICQCWFNKFSSRWRPIISLWAVVASPLDKALVVNVYGLVRFLVSAISALMSERTEGVSPLCVKSQLTQSSNITCQGVLAADLFPRSREDCYSLNSGSEQSSSGGSHALRFEGQWDLLGPRCNVKSCRQAEVSHYHGLAGNHWWGGRRVDKCWLVVGCEEFAALIQFSSINDAQC